MTTTPAWTATLYWDGGGGDNNWSTVANWNTQPDGSGGNPVAAPVAGDDVVFASGAVARLSNSCNINLSGGTGISITLNNPGGDVSITIAANVEFKSGTSIIVDTFDSLTLTAGAGAITLDGPSTFDVDTGQSLSISESINTSTFTLTIQGGGNTSISGVISNTGGITKNGVGNLTLSGANTYTGTTTINSGRLTTSAANVITDTSDIVLGNVAGCGLTLGGNETVRSLSGGGVAGGNITLGNFTLTVTQNTALSYDGIIGGTGGFTKAGAQTLTLNGANTYTGTTTISAGNLITGASNRIADLSNVVMANTAGATLTLGGDETIGSLSGGGTTGGNINLGTFTLTVTQAAALTYGGVMSGTGGLIKTGGSTLTLGGANTYTGTTSINAGGLSTNAANRIADLSDVSLANVAGVTLSLGGSETIRSLSGGGADGGNINLGTFTLTVNQNTASTYGGIISGAGGLTKAGAQTLILSGANTYTGATTINAGNLTTDSADRIADASNIVLANAAGASLTLGGNETIGSLSGGGTTGGNINLESFTLTVTQAAALTFGGVISGTGGLIKTGAQILTLTGSNTFSGSLNILSGTCNLQNATAAGTTSGGIIVSADASLQIQGGITVGAEPLTLNGGTANELVNVSGANVWGGPVTLSTTDIDIVVTAGMLTLSGVMSGNETINKSGAGTLVLSGANDFTGILNVTAGICNLRSDTAAGSTTNGIVVSAGASLELQGGITVGAETLTLNGGAANEIVNVSGLNIWGGPVTLATAAVDLVTTAGTLTLNGVMSGNQTINKSGAGTLVLSGANDFTGILNVTAGICNLRNNSAAGSTANGIVVSAGASLEIQGGIAVGTEPLTLNGGAANELVNIGGVNTWGGPVTLAVAASDIVCSADTLIISGQIGGAMGINKTGSGTLVLRGANTYTGSTTINAGCLATNAADRIADMSNIVLANVSGVMLSLGGNETIGSLSGGGTTGGDISLGIYTLTVTQATSLTYGGSISGTGGLTKMGAQTLTLSGSNTYSGTTAINAGGLTTSAANRLSDSSDIVLADFAGAVLTLGGSDTVGSLSGGGAAGGNVVLGANTLTVTQNSAQVYGGIISGTGGLTKAGLSTLTLSGANTYTGATTINAGVLATGAAERIANTSDIIMANVAGGELSLGGNETIRSLSGGGATGGNISLGAFTLTVTQSTALTYSGAISGTGGLTKAGTQTLTLGGTNTYTGVTTINAGILSTNAPERISDSSDIVLANVANAGLLLGGNETVGSISGGGTTGGNINLGVFTLKVTQNAVQTYGGIISGTGGLTKAGSQTLILSGANTYTGATTIDAGTLSTSTANRIADTSDVVFSNFAGANLTLGGNETIRSLSGGGTMGGNINLGTFTLTVTQNAALTYGGIIGGTGGLTKSGSFTLTLSGTNTYNGATTINAGCLATSGHERIADTSNVILANAADALFMLGGNETIQSLSGGGASGGNINLRSFTLTVTQNAALTYGGIIGGTGGLTKTGPQTLTLSGANSYSGPTTINAGGLTTSTANRIPDISNVIFADTAGAVLTLGGAETIRSLSGGGVAGGNVVLGASTLTVNQHDDLTYGGIISGTGGLVKAGPHTLTLNGANTYTGTTIINEGNLATAAAERISNTSDLVLANVADAVFTLGGNETIRSLSGGGNTGGNINLGTFTLTVTQNAALTYGGAISGSGGLIKSGASKLTLTGSSSFTGAVTISAGTLNIQNDYATGTTSGGVMVSAGASLEMQGDIAVGTESLLLNGGAASELVNVSGYNSWSGPVSLATAAVDIMVSQDRLSLNGIISGGQPINKTGAGQLVLAGANTFTGDLNVTVGTCILRHSTATGAIVAGTTVSAGASLQLENNISAGAEPLTLRGGAAVELENVSGTNSWGGAITLATSAVDIKSSRGTLSLGSTISGQNLIFDCGTGDIMANGTIGTGGAQTLTKYGSGNLILNGVCHFTGGATIEGGTVSFNGNSIVIGPVVVNNVGTKIAGTGTIPASSAVTMNDGTLLAPGGNNGDDAGTLTINGNLTFNFESTYIISVLPTGVDKLICGGNLVAAGNSPNVTISAPNGLTNFVSPTTIMTITGTYIKFDESAISSGFDMDDTKVGNNIRLIALQPIVPAFSGWGLFLFASLIASLSMYKIRLRRRAG